MMSRVIRVIALLAGLATAQPGDTLHVLFLGNSYTYVNDLPGLFRSLAQSGGRVVLTDEYAPGGYTLNQHSHDSTALGKINQGGWNYVVLQEQSQIPTIPHWRDSSMYPAARRLDSLIRGAGAQTAFYNTWGRKYGGTQSWGGDSSPQFRDFFEMNDSLRTAYTRIADELFATLCPVGMGWARARTQDTLVDLWQNDYSHPTLEGSYLGACVFYAVLFDESPVGLSDTGGLSPATALFCQECAWDAVSGVTEKSEGRDVRDGEILAVAPNPSPVGGTVTFSLYCTRMASLSIRDVQGRLVRILPVRNGQAVWNGLDRRGNVVAAGIYVVRADSGTGGVAVKLLRL